jgi:hypothetical protein
MPRTAEEILAQADELAKRFENFDPVNRLDGAPLRAVREAFEDLALAQKRLGERVSAAKASGHSWAAIAAMLGTSGEAARQRYGAATPAKKPAIATARAKKTPGKGAAKASSGKATAAARKGSTTSARVATDRPTPA